MADFLGEGLSYDGSLYSPSYEAGEYQSQQQSNFDWGGFGSSVGRLAENLTGIYANTWSQTQLMQQAQNGQRYIEGQRMQAFNGATGGISPLLLLLGAGLVFAFALKG